MYKKNVLITGSSRGIGRACALAFSSAGYHVFINCNRSLSSLEQLEGEIHRLGGTCTCVPGDVSKPDAVTDIFQTIHSTCAGLDILVNNAGIAHFGLLTDLSDEDWRKILDTNLSSAFYCCRAAIPHMVSVKSGRIINVSSMWGTAGASCEAAYSASKAGLHGLTKSLAKELAPSNIQVNAIACGVIDTTMNDRLNEEERLSLMEEIPAGRFAAPEEAARLILQIAESPSYMTGQIIGIDGGYL